MELKREKPNQEKARMLSVLRRMIHDIEAGYEPPFMCVVYPNPPGRQGVETLLGMINDTGAVKKLCQILDDCSTQAMKQIVLDHMGVTEKEMDDTLTQLERDLTNVTARAFDRLKKDPPVESTKEAEALLAKLMAEKDPDS